MTYKWKQGVNWTAVTRFAPQVSLIYKLVIL